MALYNSKGRISEMTEVVSGVSQNGNQWQRMTIVIDVHGFQGSVFKQAFQVSGDLVNDVLLFGIGDKVEVSWSMYAREWKDKWYNNVDLVKIKYQDDVETKAEKAAPQTKPKKQESLDPAKNPDDLPF